MKLPSITIAFQTAGIAAIARSEKGVVALLLRGSEDEAQTYTIYDASDIPEGLSADNRAYISRALIGYTKPPRYLIVRVGASTEDDLTQGLHYLETQKFDYMAGPPDISSEEAQAVASWVKNQRENNHAIYKAVLPETPADHECVINLATGDCVIGADTRLTAGQMCSRIAGLIAGTPMKIACTYAPLPELSDCARLSREEGDAAIAAGKFILIHDGQKVKVGRGINSFVTTIDGKGTAFQKIKIVECMHMMEQDIRQTAEDSYIGKYPNSYDNKCLLLTAIDGYLEQLYRDDLIAAGWTVEINLEKTRTYLKSIGVDVSGMTDDQIRRADTGDKVFIRIAVTILDAIEEIDIEEHIKEKNMDSAKRVISGTWGELWVDGELIAECTACQAKYTKNKETVTMCGQMVNDKKTVSLDGTGSLTLNKVYSRFHDSIDSILQGRDSRVSIISNLADPDSYGAERIALYNVSFDDETLADWAGGKLGTTTHPFTFTRHKFLDIIQPE